MPQKCASTVSLKTMNMAEQRTNHLRAHKHTHTPRTPRHNDKRGSSSGEEARTDYRQIPLHFSEEK